VKSLTFAGRGRIRRARFEPRSSLPIGAACVVANGVRETLGSLLGTQTALRLMAPSIPSPPAWPLIFENARLYRIRGTIADAAIVLRHADAIALASALFGESHERPVLARALSPIECDLLDRMVAAIASNLGTVCGNREAPLVERADAIGAFVTYFELLVEAPVAARIGIALSREPSPETRGALTPAHISRVELVASASLDLGTTRAADVARLRVGTVLEIDEAALQRCSLHAGGCRLAGGTCGAMGGRFALTVER